MGKIMVDGMDFSTIHIGIYDSKNQTYDKTGTKNITTDNVQDAITNLDTAIGDLSTVSEPKKAIADTLKALDTKVSECFQSVSDGKALVANAISDKGVSTSVDAEFATLATNISNIITDPNLQSKTVVLSATTTSETVTFDEGYDGLSSVAVSIHPQTKNVTLSTELQVITPDTGNVLTQVTVPAVPGDAQADDVVSGVSFSSEYGINLVGSLTDYSGQEVDVTRSSYTRTNTFITVPEGKYNEHSSLKIPSTALEKELVWNLVNTANRALYFPILLPEDYAVMHIYNGDTETNTTTTFTNIQITAANNFYILCIGTSATDSTVNALINSSTEGSFSLKVYYNSAYPYGYISYKLYRFTDAQNTVLTITKSRDDVVMQHFLLYVV